VFRFYSPTSSGEKLINERLSVTKSSSRANQYSRKGSGILGRAESGGDEDRPFAEMRRALNDGLRLLALHRWAFFVPFCLVTCGAFIGSLYYPRTYSAMTGFEVRNDPVMSDLSLSAGVASFKFFRNTMVRDLTSAECMAEVVENLGLLKDAERDAAGEFTRASIKHRDSLARQLGANLNITSTSPSELIDIVKINYTGPDPNIGRGLVDAVKRTYIRRTRAWIREFLVSQRDYFLRESEEAGKEVLAAQREETQLRLENPYINPSDPGSISARIAQLELERRELQLRKRECEGEIGAQRQLLASFEPAVRMITENSRNQVTNYVSTAATKIGSRILEIEGKVVKLRDSRGMTDEHPEIRDLLEERSELEQAFKRQQDADEQVAELEGPSLASSSPNWAGSNGEVAPFQGERTRVVVQMAALTEKLHDIEAGLSTNELTLQALSNAKSELYEKQEKFSEIMARVSKAKQRYAQIGSTLSTIEPAIKAAEQDRLLQFSEGQAAHGSVMPISPKATTIVLLAVLAGSVAGVLFVVLAEVMDHVYRSSSQVGRSLGLPILEAIDEIVTGNDRRRLIVQRVVVSPLMIVLFVAFTGLTGSMAYLSITQPWTYQRIRNIPNAALNLFIDVSPTTGGADPSPQN
jgi:uncharacterized protein involved in exopolysaccharide biosynthesis